MTPAEFVAKWAAAKGTERQIYQQHFLDLCDLLSEPKPAELDPEGNFYAFEKGAKTLDGNGFADVWRRDHFAWEYKGKRKDLGAAYKQVQTYREALSNPPLLIVTDIERFEIHTNWTNTEKWIYRFTNADLDSDSAVEVSTAAGPAGDAPSLNARLVLKAVFEDPDRLKPQKTTEQITMQAATLFGEISKWLRDWKIDEMRIARFITRMIFCMFATDVDLLPKETFSDVIDVHKRRGDNEAFRKHLSRLFSVMKNGGEFGIHEVRHFDGNLFTDDDVPEHITTQQILTLARLNQLNWTDVEPSIFGTLFERILDPNQRQKLGAHFTSRSDIELVLEPVLMAPLRREWAQVQAEVESHLPAASRWSEARVKKAAMVLRDYHKRLAAVRILDPACGSGNFLYVSLALLKALEKEVIAFAKAHNITIRPRVHPKQLFGLETSPYAVELASIVIWIGYLQWKYRNVMQFDDEDPILQPLTQVRLMDAVVDRPPVGVPFEPAWPDADVIVGNPPFLGGKRMRTVLGDRYLDELFEIWDGRVPREADLCCYWFEKARAAIADGKAERAGLLATQAIRGGKNRRVLERIKESGDIFYAQADRKWIQDGVAVRVSMVGFDDGSETVRLLNEDPDDDPVRALERAVSVPEINANLTGKVDVTKARRLQENVGISFMGDTKVGPFDIREHVARQMLASPNPHGKPNSDVVRPWVNGLDITRRPRNMWIIDFPPGTSEEEAARYEAPFEYISEHARPFRAKARSGDATGVPWWIHQRPRPDMRQALLRLPRYLGTPRVTKHRLFVWLSPKVLADAQLIVFARDDDYFFGVVHSRVHEVWARKMGTQLREAESGFRYTPTTCFETFPFPKPSARQGATIAAAARVLNDLRETWLNPQGLISDKDLNQRTLTNLYNDRPAWLANAHDVLDRAVLAAYGWPEDINDSDLLESLLELNLRCEPAE